MAGDKIEILVEGALQDLKLFRSELEATTVSILEANKAGRGFELRLKDAPASVSQLNTTVEEAVANLNKMADATNKLSAVQKAESAIYKAQLKEVADIEKAASAERKRSLKEERELNKLIREEERRLAKQNADEKKRIAAEERELNKLIKAEERELNSQRKKDIQDQIQAAKNRRSIEEAERKEMLAIQKEVSKLERDLLKQRQDEEKALKKVDTEYKRLNVAYREQVELVRKLYFEVGETDERYIQAAKAANDMSNTLKRVDAAVGIHNRNVGNYNSALMNLNQIWRELPNAGISARTFLMSLSNNLIPVIENFGQLVQQNKELAAQGQKTQSILGLIGRSIFSLTGIVSIAVTGLIILADQFIDTGDSANEAKSEIDKLQQSVQKLIDTQTENMKTGDLRNSRGTEQIKREIELMKAQGKSQDEILAKEKELRDERVRISFAELERYTSIGDALRLLTRDQAAGLTALRKLGLDQDQIDLIADDKASYNAFFNYIERKTAEVSNNIDDLNNGILVSEANINRQREEERKKDLEKRKKDAEDEYKFFLDMANKARRKALDMYDDIRSNFGKMIFGPQPAKRTKDDTTDPLSSDAVRLIRLETDMYDDLTVLNNEYQSGTLSNEQEFQRKREKIIREYALRRLKLELGTVSASIPNLSGDAKIQAVKQQAEILKQISDLEVQQLNETNQHKIDSLQKFLSTYRDVMTQIGAFAVQIGRNITEADLAEIKEREANLNIDLEKRKRDAAAQAQTEMQFNKLVTEAEFQAAQDREALRQEEIRVKQRQAIFDKANAVAQAIINSALAVTTFLAQANVPGAIAAGIAGGVQVGTILATPLPQYKDGTKDHPGGGFIAGEGGEREIVIRPDGTAYVVPATPGGGVYSEPKHTRVIPEHDWGRMPMLTPALLASLSKQDITTERMERKQDETNRILNRMMTPRPKDRPRAMLPSHYKR